MNNYMLTIPILIPVICGIFLFAMQRRLSGNSRIAGTVMISGLAITALSAVLACMDSESLLLWRMTDNIAIYFRKDELSMLFAVLFGGIWLITGIYALSYMHGDRNRLGFYGWYLLAEGPLIALIFAGNIVTFYMFFELMTLMTFPLVMHDRTPEAINAGLKYLFYSVAGAFMVLLGVFLLSGYGGLNEFTYGGILTADVSSHPGILYGSAILIIIGFGTKAGMFPMHSWLPAAHPEAPAPASAVLSGIITKSGVLGLIRGIYYCIGADLLCGTVIQKLWLVLALITVFMGSMMAYREKLLKKRLEYSTVSQISYILFGLAVMEPVAYQGAIMHIVFHALIKTMLFMAAGAYIHQTGRVRTEEYSSIGRAMPVTTWCWTLCSIALVGIPPLSGFVSKWYLATGAMRSGIAIYSWLGPVILLVSALLTAGYLLPFAFKGFFPGEEQEQSADRSVPANTDPELKMLIPMLILTILTVILGIWPQLTEVL